jgi:hypothetical protein
MTFYSLRYIESELKVRLPQEYRTLMTSTGPQQADDSWYRNLLNSGSVVVQRTLELRETAQSYEKPWRESWVWVSEVDGGDAILLDTDGDESRLYRWDHETLEVKYFDLLTRFVAG